MTAGNVVTLMHQLPDNLNCFRNRFKERINHQMDFFKDYKSTSARGCTTDWLFACGEQIIVITQTRSSATAEIARVSSRYTVQGHLKGH